jgi:hypothetical protein
MTAPGGALFITQEYTNGMAGINCRQHHDEHIEQVLAWMSDHFAKWAQLHLVRRRCIRRGAGRNILALSTGISRG